MTIPMSRTDKSTPKSRLSAPKNQVRMTSTTSEKKFTPSPRPSFIDPFAAHHQGPECASIKPFTPPVEYISPSTTPPNSPPTPIKLDFPPLVNQSTSNDRISHMTHYFSSRILNSNDISTTTRNGLRTSGEIPKPRRLSKEEITTQLVKGKLIFSTIKTDKGSIVVEKLFDSQIGFYRGDLPCDGTHLKEDDKVRLKLTEIDVE